MRQLYQLDLAQLGIDLERLSDQVLLAITNATRALQEGDAELAEKVIEGDEQLDEIALHIEELCVSLLALQAPVASDLRLIVGAMRMAQTLERQGDLAAHVAMIARSPHAEPAIALATEQYINQMCQRALKMAEMMHRLILTQDTDVVREIRLADNALDDLQVKVRQALVDDNQHFTPQQVIDLTLVARFLERFGDHAVSIANRIQYIVEGNQQ